jgi:AraC family transcriptional activator of pobA
MHYSSRVNRVMKKSIDIKNYSIRNIIDFRQMEWNKSEEFLIIEDVPLEHEQFYLNPDYYSFGLITEGELHFEIDQQAIKLSPNSIFVYRPGQLFKILDIHPKSKGIVILFTKKFLDFLHENMFTVKEFSFLSYGMPSYIKISNKEGKKIKMLFIDILKMLNKISRNNWRLSARNLLSVLIYEIDYHLEPYTKSSLQVTDRNNKLVNHFISLIARDFKKERKLEYYAKALFVSHSYLSTTIKKITGQNARDLLNEMVIREAKFLLSSTQYSISEIAYQLHFTDPYTFSKYFKKNADLSPSAFRKA